MRPAPPALASAFALVRAGRAAEGLALLHEIADAGDAEALFTLAEIYWCGGPVPKDIARGRELFRRAGEAGHAAAALSYMNLLAAGIAGERDWPGALARLDGEAARDPRRPAAAALLAAMDLDAAGDPRSLPPGERLADRPSVMIYRGAFSLGECDHLRAMAEPCYRESLVLDAAGRYVRDRVRTSDGSTIHWLIEDPAVHALNRRLAALSGTRVAQGEPLQILRYRPGQLYHPHLDWDGGPNSRVMTALVYLNEDYEGGATAFVRTGLEIKGAAGDVLLFHSRGADGGADPLSEHAGLPVTRGVKYLASRWIHEAPYEG